MAEKPVTEKVRPRECPHCRNSDGLYQQEGGSWACLDCYWDQDDE